MKAISAASAFTILILLLSCSDNRSSQISLPGIDRIISEGLDDKLFPGAVVLIASGDQILHHKAYGYARLFDAGKGRLNEPEKMTTGHLFDLASLTKVLAVTYSIMILTDQGKLNLDDPIYKFLPQFGSEEKKHITIRHLLTHTSGLMQWYPTFYVASNKNERLQFLTDRPLHNRVGKSRNYSDPGFMLLGDVVEAVSGQTLDLFPDEYIYQPLGLEHTAFNPSGNRFEHIASTSHGNPFEKRMVYDDDFGYRVDVDPESWNGWRNHTLRGEVNDANAFHTHEGIAGHAGLFSTASDIHRLLLEILNGRSEIVSDSTISKFLTPDSSGNGLGWMMDPVSLHSPELPHGSFGHTGFTGTNILAVPETGMIVVFLTNRQNFGVNENGFYPDLRELRKKIISFALGELEMKRIDASTPTNH